MAILECVLIFKNARRPCGSFYVCNGILYGHILISWDADLKAVELEIRMFRVVYLLISC